MIESSPEFRSANQNDLEPVLQLLHDAHLPVDGIAEMFAHDPTQFVLAADTGGVLAVAGVEVCCNNALLRSVAVREDWQRKGLGHDLVKRAVENAEQRGIHALYLLTMTAEHYFPRFGFTKIDRSDVPAEIAQSVEFASACPASAVVMSKSLAAG